MQTCSNLGHDVKSKGCLSIYAQNAVTEVQEL